jgi:hypothetical protein
MAKLWPLAVVVAMLAVSCGGDSPTGTTTGDPDDGTPTTQAQGATGEISVYVLKQAGEVLTVDGNGAVAGPIADLGNGALEFFDTSEGLWVGMTTQLVHLDLSGGEAGVVDVIGAVAMAEDERGLWVVHNLKDGGPFSYVSTIDPATNTVSESLESDQAQFFEDLAVGGGSAWVTWNSEPVVGRIDPDTMTIVATTEIGIVPRAMAWGGDVLWLVGPFVAQTEGELGVVRIAGDGSIEGDAIVASGSADLVDIGFGFDSVWIVDALATDLVRIDPTTNSEVARISVGPAAEDQFGRVEIDFGDEFVWVSNPADDRLYVVDPADNRVVSSVTGRVIDFTVPGG